VAKTRKEQQDEAIKLGLRTSTSLTTEEIEILRINARDNVLGRFAQKLKDIQSVAPDIAQGYVDKFKQQNSKINSIQDIIKYVNEYFDYYHCIKTQEELDKEFERAKKFVFYSGIDLPIVVEFDYQYFTEDSIFQKPTFYSYYNPDTNTSYGKGAYHIAFPSTQKLLTDDEVMVAMKHEWGHIFQGHCTEKPKDNFESKYNNQAMDISINIGMTEQEQELLFEVARKIWNNPTACPCLSLARPNGEGGFEIPVAVSATDWRSTLGFIRAYYQKKNREQSQQGPGQPGGSGSGSSSSSGESGRNEIDENINVGDFILVRGSIPKVYGRVTAINDVTGEVVFDEYTEEEWQNIKANQA
jgi:hypothetical protein